MGRRVWWACERGTLWVCCPEHAPLPHVTPRCAAIFQETDLAMCEQLASAMGVAGSGPVRARLRSGRRCFAAFVGDTIVSYAWVSRDCEEVGELERLFRLPGGERYVWDCATVPAYRGNHLYTALLGHVVSRLRHEGVRRVWIGASRANRPSIRGIAHAGFVPVADTQYVRLWRLRALWVDAHPHVSQIFVEDAVRMMARPHERRVGPMLIGGSGAGMRQPCKAP